MTRHRTVSLIKVQKVFPNPLLKKRYHAAMLNEKSVR